MKLKAIVASCALAFAGQAFALPASTTPDVQLFVSGSSAVQDMFAQVIKDMFVNGTGATATDEYFDNSSVTGAGVAKGSNYRAYFGVMKSSGTVPTALQGKKVLIYETGKGGSIMGVDPVANATVVGAVNIGSCGTASTGTDAVTGAAIWNCSSTPVNLVPDAGISDVEPTTLEAAINIPAGFTAMSPAFIASHLTSTTAFAAGMGIVVNGSAAQGSSVPATAAMLNLSKAQVAGLMNESVFDWNQIDSTVPAGTTTLVVCRRQAGSGTQAAVNAHVFGAPCQTAPLSPAGFAASTLTTGTAGAGDVVVVENSSTGNVISCMGYAQNGTGSQAIALNGGGLVAAGGANAVQLPAGNYAIGLVGLDRPAQSGEMYQFASIGGAAPTVANVSNGSFDIMVESTVNQRKGGYSTLTANQAALLTYFTSEIGNPAVLGTTGNIVPGTLALGETGAWTAPATFSTSYPVMRVSNFGNTCQPAQQVQ